MRVFITGATGLIGRRLVADHLHRGDDVVVLTRSPRKAATLFIPEESPQLEILTGDPHKPGRWQSTLTRCDAVINLAGAGIADKRWSKAYKHTLVHSRVSSTHMIVSTLMDSDAGPDVFINASAVGFYGATGEQWRDESASPGEDFLADLCKQWEDKALSAQSHERRVVCLRIGVVLDPRGGALGKMLTPFKCFIGGPLGSGKQFMPWIHWHDLVELFNFALTHDECVGPLNGVAPNPVTNREFAGSLGSAMGRPSFVPMPKFALKMAVGEFANYLTMSQRIKPALAERLGFEFKFPSLGEALFDLFADVSQPSNASGAS